MNYIKIMFSEWFGTFKTMNVSRECYENSPDIESAGSSTAVKIKDDKHLDFMKNELLRKGFKEEVQKWNKI